MKKKEKQTSLVLQLRHSLTAKNFFLILKSSYNYLLGTLPVSKETAGRSFSTLRRLKVICALQ